MIKEEFEITDKDLEGVEIIYAAYETGPYDGQALVLFKKDKKYYIVDAGHCSCYGLEGMWDPVEVTKESLKQEIQAKSNCSYQDFKGFIECCKGYFGWKDLQ
jgi:hypothetical protein